MKKNSKNKKGFSFIELMITIAIMTIMSAITLASMNAGQKLWAVKTAAREVAATVREVQNYALTGKDLKDKTSICVFTFEWVSGSSTYLMEGCKTQSYVLKNGVNFSGSGNFSFSVPFANLNPPSIADIKLNKGGIGGIDYHVCVYASGAVKEAADACPAS